MRKTWIHYGPKRVTAVNLPGLARYLLTLLVLGLTANLLLELAQPANPWLSRAGAVVFAIAVIHPPRRPWRQVESLAWYRPEE